LKKALISGGYVAANILGQSIVPKSTGGQIGSMLGGAIGGNLAKSLFKNIGGVTGSALGIFGSFAGSIAGGFLGNLIGGKDDEPQEQLIRSTEKNTDAIERNTLALKQLDKSIFNAPTKFNVPAFAGSYGNVTIHVSSNNNPQQVAIEVAKIIDNNYSRQMRNYGTRGYTI